MVLLTLLAAAALASCAGSDTRNASGGSGAAASRGTLGGNLERGDAGGKATVDLAIARRPGGSQVVHTATVTLEANDAPRALRRATTLVRGLGGYLFSSSSGTDDDTHVRAVFKVPPEHFDAVLEQLAGIGKVTTSETGTEDVTGQVVDLEARLAAARASAGRLRDLLAQAGNVADLLGVEQALAARESEVESLAAQLGALRARVDMATINVELRPGPAPGASARPSRDIPGFVAGLRTGAAAFANTALVGATALGAALPFLGVALLAGVPGRWLLSRRRARAVAAP